MSITIADKQLAAALTQSGTTVEVRGADGEYLGVFTPARLKVPTPDISETELARREDPSTGTWHTATAVEDKLKELRCTR